MATNIIFSSFVGEKIYSLYDMHPYHVVTIKMLIIDGWFEVSFDVFQLKGT